MKGYQFKGLLQNQEWLMPAYVTLDNQGKIHLISENRQPDITYAKVNGYVLPGFQNAHSHAFQYAMVGLTEQHDLKGNRDDFWGWRKAMYQLALSVGPDHMEAIATMLYTEMLRHGYTEVAEFHYVHHQQSGQHYINKAELGERLIAAASTAGIKITLIPIFYQKGGFGQKANESQRRFLSKDIAEYEELLEASKVVCRHYKEATIGCGVHSMRAVEPLQIKTLTEQLEADMPFHIHVAEQLKEIEASLLYLGKRPVEWLTENMELNENFHLVHCTHLDAHEIKTLAQSKANAVLCPSTEGNLADGLFPLKPYQNAGGNWCIGTDSHIGLNPFEELRLLDYGQRLTSYRRNSFTDKNQGNSGIYALNKSIVNGRKTMGKTQSAFFQTGQSFDALVLDSQTPILAVCSKENLASTMLYASDVSMHLGTIVNGEWVVKKGRHQKGRSIKRNFIAALKNLNNR